MDIDIDTFSAFTPKDIFPQWCIASMVTNNELRKHPVGVYPQNIPVDPITKLSAIPYKDAEKLNYFKMDFLHLKVYDHFNSREEIELLIQEEPSWDLLQSPSICKQLFQLGNPKHFSTIQKMNPKSIEDIADVIAIIRPGKIWLLSKYLENKTYARKKLYEQIDGVYSYRKSHAVAYALVVILQLHLIESGVEF